MIGWKRKTGGQREQCKVFKTCFTEFSRFSDFDEFLLVGGFVDENVFFREYIKKYASYGGEPKSQNGENRSVFATMRVGAALPTPLNENRLMKTSSRNSQKL